MRWVFVVMAPTLAGCAEVWLDGKDVRAWERAHNDTHNDTGSTCAEALAQVEWAEVPAGTFMMGSPEDEEGRESYETQHEVTLTGDYFISTTEVPQGLFEACMGTNPSLFHDCGPDCPVEEVTWHDAAALTNALSDVSGLDLCYDCSGGECESAGNPYDCDGYRLPTEAEWEYAARAGTTTRFYWGDSDDDAVVGEYAWYYDNSDQETHEVGLLEPNDLGLHDVAGNVWEWVEDGYDDYPTDTVTDPVVEEGSARVYRGGAWDGDPVGVRVALRNWDVPGVSGRNLGFRLARSSP